MLLRHVSVLFFLGDKQNTYRFVRVLLTSQWFLMQVIRSCATLPVRSDKKIQCQNFNVLLSTRYQFWVGLELRTACSNSQLVKDQTIIGSFFSKFELELDYFLIWNRNWVFASTVNPIYNHAAGEHLLIIPIL
jgi:hypothetical protein